MRTPAPRSNNAAAEQAHELTRPWVPASRGAPRTTSGHDQRSYIDRAEDVVQDAQCPKRRRAALPQRPLHPERSRLRARAPTRPPPHCRASRPRRCRPPARHNAPEPTAPMATLPASRARGRRHHPGGATLPRHPPGAAVWRHPLVPDVAGEGGGRSQTPSPDVRRGSMPKGCENRAHPPPYRMRKRSPALRMPADRTLKWATMAPRKRLCAPRLHAQTAVHWASIHNEIRMASMPQCCCTSPHPLRHIKQGSTSAQNRRKLHQAYITFEGH